MRPPKREALISRRQQLATKEAKYRAQVAMLLERVIIAHRHASELSTQVMLIDFELDKLVDEKIATAWEEPSP